MQGKTKIIIIQFVIKFNINQQNKINVTCMRIDNSSSVRFFAASAAILIAVGRLAKASGLLDFLHSV